MRGGLEHLEVVAQPLYQRSSDGNRTFQGIDGGLVTDLVADGGQQTVLGEDGLLACVHEHEAAGAVRVLRHALLEASLAKSGGLLIAKNAGDRGIDQQAVLATIAVDLGGGLDLRKHGLRNPHDLAHRVVPLQLSDVHEHGSGRVGRIGDVHATVSTASQVPQHPSVHVTEEQIAGLGPRTGSLNVVENPFDLRAREIGRQAQTTDLLVAVGALVTS